MKGIHFSRGYSEPSITLLPKDGEIDSRMKVEKCYWEWNGYGATEWWFDDRAVLIEGGWDERSNSGLTACYSATVAYNKKIKLISVHEDIPNATQVLNPQHGVIYGGWVNAQGGWGGGNKKAGRPHPRNDDWTGFALGYIDPSFPYRDDRYQKNLGHGVPIIGDDLEGIIEICLSQNVEGLEKTTCRHLPSQQVYIKTVADSSWSLSRWLCTACRTQGVRWNEFFGRNIEDACPYLRKAIKATVDKTDSLPDWFKWNGRLINSIIRCKDGEVEVYEVTYLRGLDSFVRKAIIRLDNEKKEVRMFSYQGFVPKNLADFEAKYKEGNIIFGKKERY